jgi:hypothetical protein
MADPDKLLAPGFWMNETSGVLRPAVEAYLRWEPLSAAQIAALRAYLRQWIEAYAWLEEDELFTLRQEVDQLTSREAIDRWLDAALDLGIDPL